MGLRKRASTNIPRQATFASIIFCVIIASFVVTSCYPSEEYKERALQARQKKASTRDYSMTPPMMHDWSDADIQKEPVPPPSTDPASDANWTERVIALPEGMRMRDAGLSGREACILAYDAEGNVFVGTVSQDLQLREIVKSAPSPKGYIAVNSAIAGGKAYALFEPGEYKPDKPPQAEVSGEYRAKGEPLYPRLYRWDSRTNTWAQVNGLPRRLERIYANGGQDVILLCRKDPPPRREFYAYRPGGKARYLFSETNAVNGISEAPEGPMPAGAYSFYGSEALCAVSLEGEYDRRKYQRHTHRWLALLKPGGNWEQNVRLDDLWSAVPRQAEVLNLPGNKYVFLDGGICEYSKDLSFIRRFRLPDAMLGRAAQRQAITLPLYGGLLTFSQGSRRLTVMLQPELGGQTPPANP